MFTPTRTALYLAISAMAFGASDANAGCKVISGSYVCASWIKGSEICQVTIETAPVGLPPLPLPTLVECSITGADVTYPNGPASPSVCPASPAALPSGNLTCGAPEEIPSFAPGGVSVASISANDWRVFGVSSVGNSVSINGGSTINGTVGSNASIALTGSNTKIYGDASAVGTVSPINGAAVTGTIDNNLIAQVPDPVPGCSPYSSAAGITVSAGGSYTPATGVLKQAAGGTISLNPSFSPYCFSTVTLSGGSTLAYSDATTINMTGALQISGGSRLSRTTSFASLTINSSASTSAGSVTLNGSRGANVTVNAPNADIKFGIGSVFSGAFIGKTVTASGASAINNPLPAVMYDENGDPITSLSAEATPQCIGTTCTAIAEIEPPADSTCENGGPVLDFTADQFIATVRADFPYPQPSLYLYQWCTLNGSTYSCTDLEDPYAMCDGGEGYGGGDYPA